MFAVIPEKDWKDDFLTNGITAGDTEDMSVGQQVILCVHFITDEDTKDCKIVEFNKPLSYIFVDWDRDQDGFETDNDHHKPDYVFDKERYDRFVYKTETNYALYYEEKKLERFTMKGSFVKSITALEIVKVHDGNVK